LGRSNSNPLGINVSSTEKCDLTLALYMLSFCNDKYFLVFDYGCGKCDVLHPKNKCVDCDTGPLCNTEEFINKSKFCLWKTENMSKPVGMKRVCKDSCFVLRDKNGKGKTMKIGGKYNYLYH